MPFRKKSKNKVPKKINTKRKVRRNTKKRIRCLQVKDIDRFYQILNMVQLRLKEVNVFIEDPTLSPTVENIMRDLGVVFHKHKDIDRYYYHISPPKKTPDNELVLDEIEDEDVDILLFDEKWLT